MKYIIFCKPTCPFCTQAVEVLEDAGKDFSVVNFSKEQQNLLEEMKLAMDWSTVPMVFTKSNNDMKFIGGFTDLTKHLEDG